MRMVRSGERPEEASDSESEFVPCDGVGATLFIDATDRKFYSAFQTADLRVSIGDCVRVALDSGVQTHNEHGKRGRKAQLAEFGFGQVMSIFEDRNEEMFAEVRWFILPHELTPRQTQMINPKPDEMIESDIVDDIAAGSVCEIFHITGAQVPSTTSESNHTHGGCGVTFTCRYFCSTGSNSIQKVSPLGMFRRSMDSSAYKYAYVDYMKTYFDASHQTDDFSLAIQRLHISVIPDSLPCREEERQKVEKYLRSAITYAGASSPLYVCGMPGTGKTATILSVINALRIEADSEKLPKFNFLEINCLRLKSPSDAYVQLWRGLSGYHVSSKVALRNLRTYFSDTDTLQVDAATGKAVEQPVTICLMDELDYLITRDFHVIYNFFEWPMQKHSRLVVIGITNTMDLLERLPEKVTSRSNTLATSRLVFVPYSHEQVYTILSQRLQDLNLAGFETRAIEFVARKSSTAAGDLRSALRICQNTIELHRTAVMSADKSKPVTDNDSVTSIFALVKKAVDAYRLTPFISVARSASELDKGILLCLCKYRRQVCGGDEHSAAAGLTLAAIWDRFSDQMSKVAAVEFTGDLVAEAEAARGQSGGAANSTKKRLIMRSVPPMYIFEAALSGLVSKGLLTTTSHFRPCGRRVLIYHVHHSFLYSDFVAAVADHPWSRFVAT